MKCIRVRVPKEPLVYTEDEPIPKPPKGGAVVKIAFAGVCHTDLHFWEGGFTKDSGEMDTNFGFKYPCSPGHEIAGTVFSLDESVADGGEGGLRLGDPVVVFPWIYCGVCKACKAGYNDVCDGSPQSFIGLTQDGGFEEYVAVQDVRYLVPTGSIPLDVACMLPCSGLTAFHAVEEGLDFTKFIMETKGNCSVLVLGAGGLGQWALRFARALCPPGTQVICADVKPDALNVVAKIVPGVDTVVIPRDQSSEDTAGQIKALTHNGYGVDLVLDFVGATQTYQVGRHSLRTHGHYHVIGLLGGESRFHLPSMIWHGIQMKGIMVGGLVRLKRLIQFVLKKPDVYDNLQFKIYPLEEGIQVMENLAKGKVVGRSILRCADGK